MLNSKEAGLKVGLELHRQINTHKLFCKCPSILREDQPDIVVDRWLHAVASETGEEDVVASFEKGKGRHARYEAYHDTTCELELDEQPVNDINQEALQIALQVCKLLNCSIVDDIQVMRKQVLDYSNTSGFQRTMLIGFNGGIETKSGRVTVATVCLEEDAARKISEDESCVVYRLDRLGVPLIEIATAPDMHDPEQAQEVAKYLGMVMKSTGKMKSGLGTVRQDVNVSIQGHPRVEIKGVQDLAVIPEVIRQEMERQAQNLQSHTVKSEVRKANIDGSTSFLRPMPGAARLYPETDASSIQLAQETYQKLAVPKLLVDKANEFIATYRISKELASSVMDNDLFIEMVEKIGCDPSFAARLIIEIPKELKSRLNLDTTKLSDDHLRLIAKAVTTNRISKDAALEALADVCRGNPLNLEKFKTIDPTEVEQYIQQILHDRPSLNAAALMGEVMKKYRGKLEGKVIASLVGKYAKP